MHFLVLCKDLSFFFLSSDGFVVKCLVLVGGEEYEKRSATHSHCRKKACYLVLTITRRIMQGL